MPTPILVTFVIVASVMLLGMLAFVAAILIEELPARTQESPGWEQSDLRQMLHEQSKEAIRCPGCRGTRCYDWKRNGRSCEHNPTTAEETGNLLGKHTKYGVKAVPAGWWPLPKTHMARTARGRVLWAKVADHCQISLARPVGTVLP